MYLLLKQIKKNKNLYYMLLIITYVSFFQTDLFSAHPLITDDTGTQGKGKSQYEFMVEHNHDKQRSTDKTLETIFNYNIATRVTTIEDLNQFSISLCYGVIDNLDFIIGFPYQHIKTKEYETILSQSTKGRSRTTESGLSDISVDFKWKFAELGAFSFALKPGITIPIGDEEKGFGTGRIGASGFLITSIDLKPLVLHINLGYIRNQNAKNINEREDIWHASLATEIQFIKNMRFVTNTGLERNPDKLSNLSPCFVLGGFIYSFEENIDIDLGFKYGLTKPETDYSILGGITFRK